MIAMVVLAGMGSAALLEYYGMITGTVDVEQSVLIDGGNYLQENIYGADRMAGSSVVTVHTLKNKAVVPATVRLDTSYDPDEGGIKTTYTTTVTEEADYDAYYDEARIMVSKKVGTMSVTDFLAGELEYTVNVVSNPLYAPNICFWITNETNIYVVEAWGKDWTTTGLHTVTIQDFFSGAMGYEVTVDTNYGQANRISPDRPGTYAQWKGTGITEFIEDYGSWTVLSAEVRAQAGAAGGQVIRPIQFKVAGDTINFPDVDGFESVSDDISVNITLQPGQMITFPIKTNFDVALTPGMYNITTRVIPVPSPVPGPTPTPN